MDYTDSEQGQYDLLSDQHSEEEALKRQAECDELRRENEALKKALRAARVFILNRHGITTREFAKVCGISAAQLSAWTSEIPNRPPDLIERSKN